MDVGRFQILLGWPHEDLVTGVALRIEAIVSPHRYPRLIFATPHAIVTIFAQFDFETRETPTDYLGGDNRRDTLPSTSLLAADAIVPCPRRFGAAFAPNGTLVVFSSALVVLRARTSDGTSDGISKRDERIVKQVMDAVTIKWFSLFLGDPLKV